MSDTTQQLEKLGEEWAAAELSGDTDYLGRLLVEDFVGVGPRGFMLSKEQWLSRHRAGNLKYESFGLDEVQVRPYGDAAIAVCRPDHRGSVRGRERPLRHPGAVPRDAHLREAAGPLAACRLATEPHPGQTVSLVPTPCYEYRLRPEGRPDRGTPDADEAQPRRKVIPCRIR